MKRSSKRNAVKEIAEELDIFDDMLNALVELLEEKGILTHEEWEERVRKKVDEAGKLKSYRNLQFQEDV